MISFTNIQRYDNLPFEDYLKLPGMSHSYLKSEYFGEVDTIAETAKIRIGKMVDAFLTEPASVDYADPNIEIAERIAAAIRVRFGHVLDRMQKQISYTADVSYMNHTAACKFRLDFLLPGILVLDLKVTHEPMRSVPALVDFMGYRNQLWGYAKASQVDKGYLLVYSVPSKRLEIFNVPILSTNDFWRDKILKFGNVAA